MDCSTQETHPGHSYPQWDGKWVVAYGLQGEGPVWLTGAVVCLLAANRGSNCSLRQAMNDHILRCGIISSCQWAATSEIAKALLVLSPSHVRSAIASTRLYLYLFYMGCSWKKICDSNITDTVTTVHHQHYHYSDLWLIWTSRFTCNIFDEVGMVDKKLLWWLNTCTTNLWCYVVESARHYHITAVRQKSVTPYTQKKPILYKFFFLHRSS